MIVPNSIANLTPPAGTKNLKPHPCYKARFILREFIFWLACSTRMFWIWTVTPVLVGLGRRAGKPLLRIISALQNHCLAPVCLAVWKRTGKERFISPVAPSRIELDFLDLEPNQAAALLAKSRTERRIEIGEFDQDGLLYSEYGRIGNIPSVTNEDFLPRNQTSVRLLLLDGSAAVEKDFRGVKATFVKELLALRRLNKAGCRVPAILDADFKKCRLTIPLVKGKVLREELAGAGAMIRDREIAGHTEYRGLSAEAARLKRIEAGKKVLPTVVTDGFVRKLYGTLQDLHTAGVALMDIKYGNILIEERSGEPRFIDFDQASTSVPWPKFLLNLLRDHDRRQFNLHFGTQHFTYERLIKELRTRHAPAPVYFGQGLCLGDPREACSRHVRWRHFAVRHLPPLDGGRVLNLGAGDGFDAIQFLRLGAREVVAIESDAKLVRQANFLKEAFEWADNRRYNLECLQTRLSELATRDLGSFDLVFAHNCLNYFKAGTAAPVLKHISTITHVLVCQSSLPGEPRHPAHPNEETTFLHFSKCLIQENGFRVSSAGIQPFDSRAYIIAEAA